MNTQLLCEVCGVRPGYFVLKHSGQIVCGSGCSPPLGNPYSTELQPEVELSFDPDRPVRLLDAERAAVEPHKRLAVLWGYAGPYTMWPPAPGGQGSFEQRLHDSPYELLMPYTDPLMRGLTELFYDRHAMTDTQIMWSRQQNLQLVSERTHAKLTELLLAFAQVEQAKHMLKRLAHFRLMPGSSKEFAVLVLSARRILFLMDRKYAQAFAIGQEARRALAGPTEDELAARARERRQQEEEEEEVEPWWEEILRNLKQPLCAGCGSRAATSLLHDQPVCCEECGDALWLGPRFPSREKPVKKTPEELTALHKKAHSLAADIEAFANVRGWRKKDWKKHMYMLNFSPPLGRIRVLEVSFDRSTEGGLKVVIKGGIPDRPAETGEELKGAKIFLLDPSSMQMLGSMKVFLADEATWKQEVENAIENAMSTALGARTRQ